LDVAPAQPEAPKPAKKYLSLEEVEAQLLASQRTAQPANIPQTVSTPPAPQSQPRLPSGPPAPQHVAQQQYYEENAQFRPFPTQQQQQFRQPMPPGPAQYAPPPQGPMAPHRSPQRSPVR